MHEFALTQRLVQIVDEHAQGAVTVLRIMIEIGDISGVVAEAVEFCFDVCAQGTKAEGAELVIKRIAGRGWCGNCENESSMQNLISGCPQCQSVLTPRFGMEMKLCELIVCELSEPGSPTTNEADTTQYEFSDIPHKTTI